MGVAAFFYRKGAIYDKVDIVNSNSKRRYCGGIAGGHGNSDRKGKPGAYETPYEIESFAQVADSGEGRAMHRLYEEVRYGKGQ